MEAILISLRLKWFYKICKKDKTIEIRGTAPRDFNDLVYIYVCKTNWEKDILEVPLEERHFYEKCVGRVCSKFTLRKVEEFIQGLNEAEYENLPNFALKDYDYHGLEDLMEKACLNDEEINEYAPDLSFYAWHISDLVIFDKPKELSEFGVKRPPQSWQYVEVRE